MRYVLALDQGTTSSRAIVFDERGAACALAQKEFRQHFPQPGWVEHDAVEILRTQLACARAVLKKAKLAPGRLAAIGITNQRETTVVWDRRSGKPVHRAIVWQDRRTAARCEALKREGLDKTVQAKTGLVVDPYFSATKLEWLLENVSGLRARADRGELAFGTIDTWLAWQLSGGALHVTDPSNASRTMLYDIHRGEWDEELLRIFRVPRSMLPEVLPSSHVYGTTAKNLLGAELPIAGIAGDQQAALFGQACHEAGMAKNTYGTGCFLLLNTGDEAIASRNGLIATCAAQAGPKQFALEGSVFTGGAVVQWLRDGLRLIRKSVDVEKLAASVRPGRAALGSLCARHHCRTHARIQRGPYRARCSGIDRLSIRGPVAGHGTGLRTKIERAARRRRRRGRQSAHAVPGRPARHPRRASAGSRDHGAGRGVSRGPGHRRVDEPRRNRETMESCETLRAEDEARGSEEKDG